MARLGGEILPREGSSFFICTDLQGSSAPFILFLS